jgi:hypothetical protein
MTTNEIKFAHARLLQAIFQFPKGELKTVAMQVTEPVQQTLRTRLGELSARQERLLRQVYGIGVAPLPMTVLAREWGTTPDRVRSIRDNALFRLRHKTCRGPLAVELQEAGMCFPGLAEAVAEQRELEAAAAAGALPLDSLELSTRTTDALRRDGITTVAQLLQKSEDELLRVPKFGRKSLQEIKELCASHGWRLRGG